MLLIDTPRWPWRGRLWAHLISDQGLDELHEAARLVGLRYLSFGCDHYDVPDTIWAEVCNHARVVDSREIVRTLRAAGLRVGGGKERKAWRRLDGLPASIQVDPITGWLARLGDELDDAAIEYLTRPGEFVVLHLLAGPERPSLGALREGPGHAAVSVRETVADHRYSLEVIVDETKLAD